MESKKIPVTQEPVLLPVRKLPTLIARYMGNVGAVFGRVLLTAISFAVGFLLVFSFNSSYTGELIGGVIDDMFASAAKSEASSTVNTDVIEPFEYAAVEFTRAIDTYVYEYIYGEVIYEYTSKR